MELFCMHCIVFQISIIFKNTKKPFKETRVSQRARNIILLTYWPVRATSIFFLTNLMSNAFASFIHHFLHENLF